MRSMEASSYREMKNGSSGKGERSLLGVLAVLLVILPILPGCQPEEEPPTVTLAEAFAFEPLGRGNRARLDTAEVVIREAATWAAYQDSLRPLQPFGTVNFAQEMVLLAAVPVPSGGYSVLFETVEKIEDGLTATYVLSVPGPDCRATMGTAVVFQAVRVARFEGAVRFVREADPYRCTEP